jgi:ketosteroid isomerase-like protein
MSDLTTPIEAITALFWHSDHHQWSDLEAVFADRVRLDYTALQGGEPTMLAPADIVAGWRPGFEAIDAHQHLVANHRVSVDGQRATATASFIATHRWRDATWTLGGDYRFELTRSDSRWVVSAMTMTPVWETGERDLIESALAHGKDGSGEQPRTAVDVATDFLARLGELDIEGALANFADDAVQEMPYSPAGFPQRLDGLEAIRRQYGGLPDAYRSMHFEVAARHQTTDPARVVLEYTGSIELNAGGRYDNTYIGVFDVVDGRITRFREYFDPIVLQAAFGDDISTTFSVEDQ